MKPKFQLDRDKAFYLLLFLGLLLLGGCCRNNIPAQISSSDTTGTVKVDQPIHINIEQSSLGDRCFSEFSWVVTNTSVAGDTAYYDVSQATEVSYTFRFKNPGHYSVTLLSDFTNQTTLESNSLQFQVEEPRILLAKREDKVYVLEGPDQEIDLEIDIVEPQNTNQIEVKWRLHPGISVRQQTETGLQGVRFPESGFYTPEVYAEGPFGSVSGSLFFSVRVKRRCPNLAIEAEETNLKVDVGRQIHLEVTPLTTEGSAIQSYQWIVPSNAGISHRKNTNRLENLVFSEPGRYAIMAWGKYESCTTETITFSINAQKVIETETYAVQVIDESNRPQPGVDIQFYDGPHVTQRKTNEQGVAQVEVRKGATVRYGIGGDEQHYLIQDASRLANYIFYSTYTQVIPKPMLDGRPYRSGDILVSNESTKSYGRPHEVMILLEGDYTLLFKNGDIRSSKVVNTRNPDDWTLDIPPDYASIYRQHYFNGNLDELTAAVAQHQDLKPSNPKAYFFSRRFLTQHYMDQFAFEKAKPLLKDLYDHRAHWEEMLLSPAYIINYLQCLKSSNTPEWDQIYAICNDKTNQNLFKRAARMFPAEAIRFYAYYLNALDLLCKQQSGSMGRPNAKLKELFQQAKEDFLQIGNSQTAPTAYHEAHNLTETSCPAEL